MKMNQLRKMISEQIRESMEFDAAADKFISTVLRIPGKRNVFDEFMRKEGLPESELTVFIQTVMDKLRKYTD